MQDLTLNSAAEVQIFT